MSLPAHYKLAMSEKGLAEIPGRSDNPKIISMFRDVGHGEVDNDETSWCAVAVGSWLERSGIKSTKSLTARSYLNWGHEVGTKDDLSKCLPGDVVVFWRVRPDSWKGHVGLFVRATKDPKKIV